MAKDRLTEEQRRELMTRQAALTALTTHPSWPQLEAEVVRKQGRIERIIVARAFSSEGFDQRQADYLRGFVAGMRWFVSVPTSAESTLERFLKEQGIRVEGE